MAHPVLLGDSDMVRALALAGLDCVLVAPPGDVARHSRHVVATIDATGGDLPGALEAHAHAQDEPPVLYVQSDEALLLASRHRHRLLGPYRATLPDAELVEDIVDKARFQDLAGRLGIDVPRAAPLGEHGGVPLPCVVKPCRRDERWHGLAGWAKALLAADARELADLAARLEEAGIDAVAQELVAGPESRIATYHAYRAADGETLGEFTGGKVRTRPAAMGRSTAVMITDDDEVRAGGRDVVARLGLTGPVKVDFKRDERGVPRLLEVNPRFTLWVHPGALAGVNLAAIAHADLTGGPRPANGRARPGVRWCDVVQDAAAVREESGSLLRWLRFALGSKAYCAAEPAELRGRLLRRAGR